VSNELNELTFSSFPPPPVVEGLPRTSDDMDAAQSYNLNVEWGATALAASDTDAVPSQRPAEEAALRATAVPGTFAQHLSSSNQGALLHSQQQQQPQPFHQPQQYTPSHLQMPNGGGDGFNQQLALGVPTIPTNGGQPYNIGTDSGQPYNIGTMCWSICIHQRAICVFRN